MTTFYKIQSRKTGLFSTGGQEPKWSKIGKVWPVKGHLSSHFTGLTSHGRRTYREHEAEVVECTVAVLAATPVEDFILAAVHRQQDRRAAEARYLNELEHQRKLAEFERLGRELGRL